MSTPKHGVHRPLEDEANRILKESMRGITSQSAKSDILTPWKERDRLSREVYSNEGVVDAAIRRGSYGRAYNPTSPHLNSRDGVARGSRTRVASMQAFVDEHGYSPDSDA